MRKRAQERGSGRRALAATTVEERATQASTDPSLPVVQLWNTDTGASSHMTPHCQWFKSYTSRVIPIRLADHSLVYSEGIGTIQFQP
ncbi:hypothetical protein F5876DRAFT_52235, partial [Lentinula aff. lateritia]